MVFECVFFRKSTILRPSGPIRLQIFCTLVITPHTGLHYVLLKSEQKHIVLFITNYLFLYSIVSLVDLKCVLQKYKGTLYPRRQTCQAREGIFVNLHIDFSLFVVNPAFMRVLSTNFEVNSYI